MMMNSRNKHTIIGVVVAVLLVLLVALGVVVYFVYPRTPVIARKSESSASVSLVPFAVNFTENYVINNTNYLHLSISVRAFPIIPSLSRILITFILILIICVCAVLCVRACV